MFPVGNNTIEVSSSGRYITIRDRAGCLIGTSDTLLIYEADIDQVIQVLTDAREALRVK